MKRELAKNSRIKLAKPSAGRYKAGQDKIIDTQVRVKILIFYS